MSATVGLVLAGGAAAVALALARRSAWREPAAWFSLAVIGQAAMLQLVEAGSALRYQHYPPVGELLTTHPRLLAMVALQATLVGAGLTRHRSRLRAALRAAGPWRVGAAVGLTLVVAATVSPTVSRYVQELAFAAGLQLLSLANVVLLALSLPDRAVADAGRWLDRVLGRRETDAAPAGDRFGLIAAGLVFVTTALLAVFSYQRHPHIPDEVGYFFHARYFAEGWLTLPAPPVPDAFSVDLMYYEATRWFCPMSPGWPAVLAVGVFFGVPWLVNPALAGLCVWLAYNLFGWFYPPRYARLAVALLAASPWFLFLGMSYMTHIVTLACALIAAVSVVRARQHGTVGWGLLGGLAVGASSLVRPVDGLVIGLLIAAWAFGIGGARLRIRSLAGLGLGTVLAGGLILPYNDVLTGDPLRVPVNLYFDTVYWPKANAYGFGPERGLDWPLDPNPGHSPVDGLINTNLNVFGLNTDLFGWSAGSVILIAWVLVAGRLKRRDWMMLVAAGAFPLAYFFYYYGGGPDFGARYWFPMIVPLVALTVAGVRRLEPLAGPRALVAVAALSVMAFVTFVPWRAADKYLHFRGMRPDIRQLAANGAFDGDLVLIQGNRTPDYASAFVYNPVDLADRRRPIFAWDRGPDVRAALVRAYPDRRIWVVEGPSVTGSGYRIQRGPIDGRDLLPAGDGR